MTPHEKPTILRLNRKIVEGVMMYIKRHMEEIVKECIAQFPVLLVTGPRQVGKTTMLTKICDYYTYCTFDDPLILREAVEETKLFLMNNEPPLLIDEVQYTPEIFDI